MSWSAAPKEVEAGKQQKSFWARKQAERKHHMEEEEEDDADFSVEENEQLSSGSGEEEVVVIGPKFSNAVFSGTVVNPDDPDDPGKLSVSVGKTETAIHWLHCLATTAANSPSPRRITIQPALLANLCGEIDCQDPAHFLHRLSLFLIRIAYDLQYVWADAKMASGCSYVYPKDVSCIFAKPPHDWYSLLSSFCEAFRLVEQGVTELQRARKTKSPILKGHLDSISNDVLPKMSKKIDLIEQTLRRKKNRPPMPLGCVPDWRCGVGF